MPHHSTPELATLGAAAVMVDASTQTDDMATGISHDSPLLGTPNKKQTMIDASTQTECLSQVGAESSGQQDAMESQDVELEGQTDEEEHQTPDSEPLMSADVAAREQTREELAQLRAQIAAKDGQVENYRRLLDENKELLDQSKGEVNSMQTRLDESNSRISEFQISDRRLNRQVRSLEEQVSGLGDDLENANARISELESVNFTFAKDLADSQNQLAYQRSEGMRMLDYIRRGGNELRFFVKLSARLYTRLNRVERLSNGAFGRDDRLMRSAARRLLRWNVPVETYFRDDVGRQEPVHEAQLAIEGPTVDHSAMEQVESGYVYETSSDDAALAQLVDDYIEEQNRTTGTNGNDAGDEAERSSSENVDFQSNEKVSDSIFGAIFGAGAPRFGAQTSPDPIFAGNVGSSDHKFGAAQPDFNFGAATPFKAGSSSSAAWSEKSGVGKDEEREEGRAKKTRVGSTSEAAVDAEPSSSSSDAKKEEAKKSIFDTKFSIDLSSFSTKNKASLGSFKHDPQDTSEAPKSTSVGGFDLTRSTAKGKGKQKEERAPVFGAGCSKEFSFEPRGSAPTFGGFNGGSAEAVADPTDPLPAQDKGKGKQKEESMEKAVKASIFTAEDIAKFDSPASGKEADVDRFTFGGASASEVHDGASSSSFDFRAASAFNLRTEASSSFNFGQSATNTGQEPVENVDEMPSQNHCCPNHANYHECLYTIEEDYVPPDKRPKTTEQAAVEPVSATNSADTNGGDIASSGTDQYLLSAVTAQLPSASAGPDSSVANCEQDSSDADDEIRVKGFPVGVPCIIITPASETEVSVEEESSDIFGKFGFDVAALSRIVSSVRPAGSGREDLSMSLVPPGSSIASYVWESKIGGDIRQDRGRTAEEIRARMKLECCERAQSPTASTEWREPEWPATLPPLEAPQSESMADLPSLAATSVTATATDSPAALTQEAPSNLGANNGIEEEIGRLISAIEALYIGSSAPLTIVSNFDPEKHLLSGDWTARRHMIVERQVDSVEEEVMAENGARIRMEAARFTGLVSEGEQRTAEREVVRQGEQPGNGEVPATQEATTVWEEERSAELAVAVEARPNESSSAARSNDEVQPQMALQFESTATSTSSSSPRQPGLTSTTNEEIPERRSKYGNPMDKKGVVRIWSMRPGRKKAKSSADVGTSSLPMSQYDLPPSTNSPFPQSSSPSSSSPAASSASQPYTAPPAPIQKKVLQVDCAPPSPSTSSKTQTHTPISITSTTEESCERKSRTRYGNLKDEKGRLRIWSMKRWRR